MTVVKSVMGVKVTERHLRQMPSFPPPKNFTAEATKKDLPRERMIRSVTRGRPGTAMMPWESILSKQEIHSVVNYIRQILMGLQK